MKFSSLTKLSLFSLLSFLNISAALGPVELTSEGEKFEAPATIKLQTAEGTVLEADTNVIQPAKTIVNMLYDMKNVSPTAALEPIPLDIPAPILRTILQMLADAQKHAVKMLDLEQQFKQKHGGQMWSILDIKSGIPLFPYIKALDNNSLGHLFRGLQLIGVDDQALYNNLIQLIAERIISDVRKDSGTISWNAIPNKHELIYNIDDPVDLQRLATRLTKSGIDSKLLENSDFTISLVNQLFSHLKAVGPTILLKTLTGEGFLVPLDDGPMTGSAIKERVIRAIEYEARTNEKEHDAYNKLLQKLKTQQFKLSYGKMYLEDQKEYEVPQDSTLQLLFFK